MNTHLLKMAPFAAAAAVAAGLFVAAQTPPAQAPAAPATKGQAKSQPPAAKPPAPAKAAQAKAAPAAGQAAASGGQFYMHAKHVKELQFDCETCHVPVSAGSVVLKRPGHDQCMGCHQEAYDKVDQKYCSICHSAYPPTSKDDLLPYPQYKGQRAVLFEFSHAKHVDPKGRV